MKETMLEKSVIMILYSGVLRYTGFASSGKKSLLVSNFFFAMIATDSALPIACDKKLGCFSISQPDPAKITTLLI